MQKADGLVEHAGSTLWAKHGKLLLTGWLGQQASARRVKNV